MENSSSYYPSVHMPECFLVDIWDQYLAPDPQAEVCIPWGISCCFCTSVIYTDYFSKIVYHYLHLA